MLLNVRTKATLRDLPWIEIDNAAALRSAARLVIAHGLDANGVPHAFYRDGNGKKHVFAERAQPDAAAGLRRAIHRAVISRLNQP